MSSVTTPIFTHTADALSRLLSQYSSQQLLSGLITALVQDIQSIEDAFNEIPPSRLLATTTGASLDGIGSIINVPRNGLSDATYRAILYAAIGEDYSDGTMPTLLHILAEIFQTSAIQVVDSTSPGNAGSPYGGHTAVAFGIGSPGLDPAYFQTVLTSFFNATPASVGVYAVWTFNQADAFTMAGPQAWANQGFGDINNPSVGGGFANLIYSDQRL